MGGRQRWRVAPDCKSGPFGVRGFESPPSHYAGVMELVDIGDLKSPAV